MVRTSKLFAQMQSAKGTARFREFQRVLVAFGFVLTRTKGSHLIYKHPVVARPFPVQPRGDEAKVYQIEEFLDIVEHYGLRIDE